MQHTPHSLQRQPAGLTAIEIVVVVGILTILLSLVLPMIYSIRAGARKIQCTANLRQVQQALAMYSNDNSRLGEVYPAYLTNVYGSSGSGTSGYINDIRAFVCPMDDTGATKNKYSKTALKPVYSTTPAIPLDDKNDWAERVANGQGQWNCSYLYEFSGRACQSYVFNDTGFSEWNGDSPSNFCSTYLVYYDGDLEWFSWGNSVDPDPLLVDRNRIFVATNGLQIGTVTWQDAKFYQLNYGDIYCTGSEDWTTGGLPEPPADGYEPSDFYYDNGYQDRYKMSSYPRTWMPVARCFWHQGTRTIDSETVEHVLNVSLDGNVFESAPYWERTAFKYGRQMGDNPDEVVAP